MSSVLYTSLHNMNDQLGLDDRFSNIDDVVAKSTLPIGNDAMHVQVNIDSLNEISSNDLIKPQHINHRKNSIMLPGDVVCEIFTYLIPHHLYLVAQVCHSWSVQALRASTRIKHTENDLTILTISPGFHASIKSQLQAAKECRRLTGPITHLHMVEVDYDESYRGCEERFCMSLPLMFSMHEALQLLVELGPWPTIHTLTLQTLDDHRTIQVPRLRSVLKLMPNLTALHLTSHTSNRPVIRRAFSPDVPVQPGTDRYIHHNEKDYQIQLLKFLLSQSQVCLSKLTLPTWICDGALEYWSSFLRSPSTVTPAVTIYPLILSLTHLVYEHRNDYTNYELYLPPTAKQRCSSACDFVLPFHNLQSLSLRRWTLNEAEIILLLNRCNNLIQIDLKYAALFSPSLSNWIKHSIQARCLDSIHVDTWCEPAEFVHTDIVELGCLEIGSLPNLMTTSFSRLRILRVSCRPQLQDLGYRIVPQLCSQQSFTQSLLSFPPLCLTIRKLCLYHVPYQWLTDLIQIQMHGLEHLKLSLDICSMDDVDGTEVSSVLMTSHVVPWPKVITLEIGAIRFNIQTLGLALHAPQLDALTIEQYDRRFSPYSWERIQGEENQVYLNAQRSFEDQHLLILATCHSLSAIRFEGVLHLTANCLIALSFIESLRNVCFYRCPDILHQQIDMLLNEQCSLDVGTDSNTTTVTYLDTLCFVECANVWQEFPLQYGSQLRRMMSHWSERRLNSMPYQHPTPSHQHVLKLGCVQVVTADRQRHSDPIICELQVTSSVDLINTYSSHNCLPVASSMVVQHHFHLRNITQLFWLFRIAVDQFDMWLTPSYQAARTSHHEWSPGSYGDEWRKIVFALIFGLCSALLCLCLALVDGLFPVFQIVWLGVCLLLVTLYYENRWPWPNRPGFVVEFDERSELRNQFALRSFVRWLKHFGYRYNVNWAPFLCFVMLSIPLYLVVL